MAQQSDDIRAMLNQIAADQIAFRVILQCFIANLGETRGAQYVDALRSQVMRSLPEVSDTLNNPENMMRGFVKERAVLVFDQIDMLLGDGPKS